MESNQMKLFESLSEFVAWYEEKTDDLDGIAERAIKVLNDSTSGVVSVKDAEMEGDMMKMREALVKAKKAICQHAEHVCRSLAWENSTQQSNCGDGLCAHRDLCDAKTAIDAALSEPPRVCDVNTLESLSDFVEKTILASDLLKDTDEIVKSIVKASVRTALTVAYAPTKSE